MRSSKLSLYVCLGLLLLVAGCDGEDASMVRVASLRDNLPTLEAEARAWQQDAYLEFAHLAVLTGEFEPGSITAHFISPSIPQQTLLVSLDADGEVSTELVAQSTPQTLAKPILDDDWRLDSPQILERALHPQALQFLQDHADSQCSFMVLERDTTSVGEPLHWRVIIHECIGDAGLPTIVVDPNTGEIVGTEPR